jgi:hypothetical protein
LTVILWGAFANAPFSFIIFFKFPFILLEALFLSSFFLEKNEAKKASSLSNRFAFKGVWDDMYTQA